MKRNYNIFQNQIPIILKALHKAKRISVDLIVKCVKGYRGKKKKNPSWWESACSLIRKNHLPGFLLCPSLPTCLLFWKNHQNTFPRNSEFLLKYPETYYFWDLHSHFLLKVIKYKTNLDWTTPFGSYLRNDTFKTS